MPRTDPRVSEILALIQRVAGGDLQARLNPSKAKDDLDAIAEGLNMLAEEIEASTVSLDRYSVLVSQLQSALADVKTLGGLLPICAWCKQVRSDEGYWTKIETYIVAHSDASFTHGICPECSTKVDEVGRRAADVKNR